MKKKSDREQDIVAGYLDLGRPEMVLRGHVIFILNNTDARNVRTKSEELCGILNAQTIPWFVSYLINQWVIKENAFLEVLASVLEYLQKRFSESRPRTLSELLQAIKRILGNIPINAGNLEKKEHLKNLGRFLGILTLAQNKPVLDDDLNFKELVLEAIEMGTDALTYVIPFLTQVFKGTVDKALAPPCPYSMRVLKILKWLHENSYTAASVKFEIEIFADTFEIDLMDIPLPESLVDSSIGLHIENRCIAYEGAVAISTAAQQHQNIKNAAICTPKFVSQSLPKQHLQQKHLPSAYKYYSTAALAQDLYPQFSQSKAAMYYRPPQHHLCQRQQTQCLQRSGDGNINLVGSQISQLERVDISTVHAAVNMAAIHCRLVNELIFKQSYINGDAAKEALDIIGSGDARTALIQAINGSIRTVLCSESARALDLITSSAEVNVRDKSFSWWDLERLLKFIRQTAHSMTRKYCSNSIAQLLQKTMPSYVCMELANIGMREAFMRGLTASMMTEQVVRSGTTFIQTTIAEHATQNITVKLIQELDRRSVGQACQLIVDMGCQSAWNASSNLDKLITFKSQQQLDVLLSRAQRQQIQLPFSSMTPAAQIRQHHFQSIHSQSYSALPMETSFKLLASRICNSINNLMMLISADSQHSLGLRILRDLREITMQVTNIDVLFRLLVHTLFSFMANYSFFGDQAMDNIKRIHLSIFRALIEFCQDAWVKEQVTHAWIRSAEGEVLLVTGAHTSISDAGASTWNLKPDSNQEVVMNTWMWNWEAFSELLRHKIIHLHQIDEYLACKIETDHSEAVTFVLNLLDKFVLPALAGTPRDIRDESLGQLGMNTTQVVQTSLGNLFKVAHKREFTVLNEFDLWKSMRALEKLQTRTALVSSDSSLRLHLTCARIQALMDWGLFESKNVRKLVDKDSDEYQALFVEISRSKEIGEFETTLGFVKNACDWWCCRYKDQASNRSNLETLINQWLSYLSASKIVRHDEDLMRFFRTAINLTVHEAIATLQSLRANASEEKEFQIAKLDAFAGLLAICIKRGKGRTGSKSNISLLNRILGILGGKLMQLHEIASDDFEPLPFQRILSKLFTELRVVISASTSEDQKLAGRSQTSSARPTLFEYIPIAYGCLLHLLRPSRMPRFQLAFLEIIREAQFIRCMLGGYEPDLVSKEIQVAYRGIYAQLLTDLTSHVAFLLKNAVDNAHLNRLYSSVCELWWSLFSEFPNFISEFSLYFSNFLSISTCFLRNLVISAKPDNIRIARKGMNSSLGERFDLLEDPIGYVMEAGSRLPPLLRADIDSYLATRTPTDVLDNLYLMLQRVDSVAALLANPSPLLSSALSVLRCSKQYTPSTAKHMASKEEEAKRQNELNNAAMQAKTSILWATIASQTLSTYGLDNSVPYITEMLSDLVVYLCITAVKTLRESGLALRTETVANTPQMEILNSLFRNLDDGGQYLLVSCMVKQLRYKNSHTCYFSQCLLHIFSITPEIKLKEIISRILIEYFIMNAPRSEGLLTTYYELIANPEFRFWTGLPTIVRTLEKFMPNGVFIPTAIRSSNASEIASILPSIQFPKGIRRPASLSAHNSWSDVAKLATGSKV